MFEIEIG